MVAVELNLSPFCRRYKNVIHSSVALATKEIIELQSWARTDYLRNEIFLYETEIFYININPILPIRIPTFAPK